MVAPFTPDQLVGGILPLLRQRQFRRQNPYRERVIR